jgi:hypothetical protein
MVGGTSHILRVVGSEDLVSPGLTPTASFSPGPVTVNYILVGTARDLTISVTVPAEAAPGLQTLEITDGVLTHTVADALRIVDATILNPSPSVLSPGGSAILSVASHPLFSGQSTFSLDLGPDVSVGPIALQPDGTLQVPVSVLASAIPGTRSLHLTAGPYSFLGERGFAIDFGPLVNTVHLQTPGTVPPYMDIAVPQGYTVSIFAKPTPETGLAGPDYSYVNHGPSPGSPFSISVFDLNPGNFGAFKGVFRDIDPSGRGGLLESATMLPSRPGKLFYSTEDFTGQWPGGRTINELDTATGASRLFWYDPDWNFDPIGTDVTGNLVVSHVINNTGYQGNVSVLDPNANVLKTCPIDVWTDGMQLDPLTGKFLINRPLGEGGTQTIDVSDCTRVLRSDGPQLDEGSFGPAAGNFGNQFFVAEEGMSSVFTLVPVAYTDPDQSVPERAVLFATGFRIIDDVQFDRDAQHMLATDANVSYVFSISRIAGYAPPLPVVSLGPTSLTFGVQDVGTSSPPQTVTLANTGVATLTIASIVASPDYTQSNTCGNELAPSASCTISVSFTPIGPDIRSGYLAITDNASAQPHMIPLTGTGIGPGITFSPAALDFGLQLVGTTGTPQTVTLTNRGNTPLIISDVSTSGDYAQINTCVGTFAPGESCTITVTFTPTATGPRSGTLAVGDNAWASPQTVALSGVGTMPAVTLSTAFLRFVDQPLGVTSNPQTVTLTNSGSASLNISGIGTSGDYAQTNTCVSPILAGAGCTISVTFTTTIVGGQSGTLTISDDAPGSPHTVALNGIGVGPVVTLSATSLLFADQPLGTPSKARLVTLSNTGNAPLTFSEIAASGHYAQTNACVSPLAPGTYCTISITFTPTVVGGLSGTLTIADDALGSPHTVALNGVGLGAVATLSSSSLLFADQPLGTPSAPQAMTIGNSGNVPMTIDSIVASGSYEQTDDCVSPLAVEAHCTISVTFTPAAVGAVSGTLSITDNASGSPRTVVLSGVGLGAVTTLSSPSLLFADQSLGTSSAPQAVILSNSGNAPLTISSIAATGDYAQTSNCASPLDAGAFCTISVTFTPATVGGLNGTLSVTDNASGSPHTVALNGVGLGPVATFSPSTLHFVGQPVGTTTSPQNTSIGNSGNVPLTISHILVTGGFAQTNDCLAPLAPEAYCTISVTFTPTAVGDATGTVAIANDAAGSPHTVALDGIGLGPVVSLSAPTLNFEDQALGTTSAPHSVTLGNSGNTPLSISGITVSGDYAQTNSCVSPLDVGASCTISVTFTPTAIGGLSGTLSITDDASGSPHAVALNGIGLGPLATLSPSSLSFAGQPVGTTSPAQVITLSNSGNAPLTISTITASGDYAQTEDCGGSIAAGANCTVAVTFKPTAAGMRDGTITIRDNAAGSPRTISLSGTGQDFSIRSSVTVQTISAGSAAAYVLFVTPLGGLQTNVSLTCTGVPPAATCHISPASLTLDGTEPVQTMVTVTTTARSSSSPKTSPPRNPLGAGPRTRHALPMQLVGVLALAILASLALGRRRQIWLGLGLTLLLVSLWVACGGGGGRVAQGTPPGTYTLTITTSSAGLTHNIKLTLIVN